MFAATPRERWALAFALTAAAALALACAPSQAAPSTLPVPLYSFGDNYYGELGDGTSFGTNNANPTPLPLSLPDIQTIVGPATTPAPPEVAQVAVGNFHSLVLTSAGKLYAFGLNESGQLGNPTGNGVTVGYSFLTPVEIPSGAGVTWIAAGANHSLAVSGGRVYAFGQNQDGQLGTSADTTANPSPTVVLFPRLPDRPTEQPVITQVAAGANDSFAVTSSGVLYAFGDNSHGQLGTSAGFGTNDPAPTRVSLPGPVTQVAAGTDYTLAVTSTGQLYAFGNNEYGQLGIPTATAQTATPTLVSLPQETGVVTQVAAGGGQTLVVTSSGQLYTFGFNIYGQLGNATNIGTENASPAPTQVTIAGATGPVRQVSATGNSSLAVTSTGQLFTFGVNYFGQLGRTTNSGTAAPNPDPTLVSLPGGESVETVARGSNATHALVVASDLAVAGTSLAIGHPGAPYSQSVTASGGFAPYSWAASGLPAGLSISSGGLISGTPIRTGTANVVLTVTDADGITASSPPLSLAIASRTTTTTTTTGTNTGTQAGVPSIGRVKVEAPKATVVTVLCGGNPAARCTGALTLTAVEHRRGRTITAISAAKRPATRTVVLGRASYSASVGASAAFTIKLDGTAKSLLSDHHHFRARLTLTATGSTTAAATRTISITR
jgi:alpha-tubulin suppressor-like RCC1 family protein